MPRLSDYLGDRQHVPAPAREPTSVSPQQVHATAAVRSAPASSSVSTTAPSGTLESLHDRYLEQYRRRIRDRGPRAYRHPDGSLRDNPPAADFYSQANRARWQELVAYCRTHGGDREYDTHGFSLRYGLGVPEAAHRRLCEALGLWEELAPPLTLSDNQGDPLTDPGHPFNGEWRQLAEQVFAAAPRNGLAGAT